MKLALSYGQVWGVVKFLEASISMNNKRMDESDVSAHVASPNLCRLSWELCSQQSPSGIMIA